MSQAERMLLGAIGEAWSRLNALRFEGALSRPVFALARGPQRLGQWATGARRLELSWSLVADRPWGEVVAVLEHEMAHQYVDEVLGVHDQSPHGPTFRRVCAERGIDARAAGAPEDSRSDAAPEPKVLRRVRKLLALADSPHPAEARAAMEQAYRLMLQHNVAEADLARPDREVRVAQVGRMRSRWPKHEQLLAGLLAQSFFVEVTRLPGFDVAAGRPGTWLEVVGTPDNVATALWVWDFVRASGERLWRAHAAQHGLKGRAARNRFLEGLMLGFREQLDGSARRAAEQEGLVWVGDPEVEAFASRRYPGRRAGRRHRIALSATAQAGRAAGRRLVLRRPIREQGGGPVRRLGDRRGDG